MDGALIGVASAIAAVPHPAFHDPLAPAPPNAPPPPPNVELAPDAEDDDEKEGEEEDDDEERADTPAAASPPCLFHHDAMERSSPKAISHGVQRSSMAGFGLRSSSRK